MIVDDDQAEREFLISYIKTFFKSLVFSGKIMPEFIEAEDGLQAWRLLTEEKIVPDLIIVDFQMPKMNGGQLIDKIQKELNLHSEIVLHSSCFGGRAEAQKRDCKFVFKIGGEERIFDLAVGLGLFIP